MENIEDLLKNTKSKLSTLLTFQCSSTAYDSGTMMTKLKHMIDEEFDRYRSFQNDKNKYHYACICNSLQQVREALEIANTSGFTIYAGFVIEDETVPFWKQKHFCITLPYNHGHPSFYMWDFKFHVKEQKA